VRLYRQGDQGEPVRDIQDRLAALGFDCGNDLRGTFGDATVAAVRTFQAAKGLTSDGIVGPDTWRALVAAGFRLGDRMLYHRVPMMRGDDVADLQRRLNALGFDAGKVDGIFGPDTLRGVLDFQHNRGMPEDGIAGREVAHELDLISRATDKQGRDVVRERQWVRELPTTVAGQRIYVDAFCRSDEEAAATWRAAVTLSQIIQDLGGTPLLSRSADTAPPERVRALRANRLGVDYVVAFAVPKDPTEAVYFFSSPHSSSSAGAAFAGAIAAVLGIGIEGRATPLLKDTRAPAVVIALKKVDEHTGGKAAQGIVNLLASTTEERERVAG
jgi:N-acetylmuramoyl-L-alanine amidase